MADLPIRLADGGLQEQLWRAADPEAKVVHAIDALVGLAGRTVTFADDEHAGWLRGLQALGATVGDTSMDAASSDDLLLACWPVSLIDRSRPAPAGTTGDLVDWLDRTLGRWAGTRLVILEDYGRDDVTALLGGAERERMLVEWSRRDGPFLSRGFKLRVLHCWWSWASTVEARRLLEGAFGEVGVAVAERLRRPRLAWNVAVYHRSPPGPAA